MFGWDLREPCLRSSLRNLYRRLFPLVRGAARPESEVFMGDFAVMALEVAIGIILAFVAWSFAEPHIAK